MTRDYRRFINLSHINALTFLFGGVLSYLVFGRLGATRTGQVPQAGFNVLLFTSGFQTLHLHHWIIGVVSAIALIGVTWISQGYLTLGIYLILGALSGMIVHGIYFYDDWDSIESPVAVCQVKNPDIFEQ
jgi:hypothetical protein